MTGRAAVGRRVAASWRLAAVWGAQCLMPASAVSISLEYELLDAN